MEGDISAETKGSEGVSHVAARRGGCQAEGTAHAKACLKNDQMSCEPKVLTISGRGLEMKSERWLRIATGPETLYGSF